MDVSLNIFSLTVQSSIDNMSEDAFSIATRGVEEVVTEEGLRDVLKKDKIRVYCGYEPSGKLHFGHAVTVQKLVDFQEIGAQVVVLFADLHAYLNDKGELDEIQSLADYNRECFIGLGLDPDKTEFVMGTDYQLEPEYSMKIYKLSTTSTLNRARRSMGVIARHTENPYVAQVLYPLMQTADIDWLDLDVAIGGIDQRKVHMIAREKLPEIGSSKAVFVHTPLLLGLSGGGKKMSSSERNYVALDDSPDDIREKIQGAYCPPETVEGNPVVDYAQKIVFPKLGGLEIERPEKYGGDLKIEDFDELVNLYESGELHPADLKSGVSGALVGMFESVRERVGCSG